jgi:uncharacterized protein (TIGR01777 family)
MNVVIAGGSGFIGRTLAEELLGAGSSVEILTRKPDAARLPAGARALRWDPSQPGDWTRRIQAADAIINLCGEGVADGRWSERRKKAILESRVDSTRALVSALAAAGPRPAVLVNASAVGYYGSSGGAADEKTARGDGFLAEVCQAWESEARRAEARGARVVLLRIGVVLGRDGGALKRMLLPFKLGLGGRLGSGEQAFPWIHVRDVAGLVGHALAREGLSGPVNAVAPGAATNAEFTRALGSALGRPAVFPVPAFVLKAALGEMSGMLLEGRPVTPAAALASGYAFRFPRLDKALEDLVG